MPFPAGATLVFLRGGTSLLRAKGWEDRNQRLISQNLRVLNPLVNSVRAAALRLILPLGVRCATVDFLGGLGIVLLGFEDVVFDEDFDRLDGE